MEITEVRVSLVDGQGPLRAFASVTFDGEYAVRNIRVIDDRAGRPPLVSMPVHKLTDACPECRCRNVYQACYCNKCGVELEEDRVPHDDRGKALIYEDIFFPIRSDAREKLRGSVLHEYNRMLNAQAANGTRRNGSVS